MGKKNVQKKNRCSIRPLFDTILVAPIESPKMTEGGIALPDTLHNGQAEGKVIAVGEECEMLDPGDRLIYERDKCKEVTYKGQRYIIVTPDAALALIKED